MKRHLVISGISLACLVACANLQTATKSLQDGLKSTQNTLNAALSEQTSAGGKNPDCQASIKNPFPDANLCDPTREHSKPVYTPLSGGNSFEGLFAKQNHIKAARGEYAYPRVSLEYKKWGAELPCWQVRAAIWTNATRSHDEDFEICVTQVIVKDDLGNDAAIGGLSLVEMAGRLDSSRATRVTNTGMKRTRGPNPPEQPFSLQIAEHAFQENSLSSRLSDINARIAYVSGYIPAQDSSVLAQIRNVFLDYRLWVWKFDQAGKVQKEGQ